MKSSVSKMSLAVGSDPQSSGFLALLLYPLACPCLSSGLAQVLSQQWLSAPRICFLDENGTPTFPFSPPSSTLLRTQSFLNDKALGLLCCSCLISLAALVHDCVHCPLGPCPSADLHHELDSV